MNTPALNSTVYVRWYNSVLQGVVVPNDTPADKLLGSMVAVRIPLQGSQAIALFTPAHVYAIPPDQPDAQTTVCCDLVATEPPTPPAPTPKVSPAWQRIQDFKAAHWDEPHNRLRIDALDEFYQMWRNAVAEKVGYKVEPVFISPSNIVAIIKQVSVTTTLNFWCQL